MPHPREWIEVRPQGVYCVPGDFYIDPLRPVDTAVITHGHADHARAGHGHALATPETLAIMQCRYGEEHAAKQTGLPYKTSHTLNGVNVSFYPAGHILGSAQAVLEFEGSRIVFAGDYKRRHDPTCAPFECVPCDVFVTEATFGLPVFTHPPIEQEVAKLLESLRFFPERCHLVGVYALGKCQRVMLALREAGYDRTLYLHGALVKLCELYEAHGIALGDWQAIGHMNKKELAGEIVLAPPGQTADRWSRNLPEVMPAVASGWMQIRARAKQRRVEMPLIISDHADWNELIQTLRDVDTPEIWVTHGREEALVHYATRELGLKAQALSLLGYEEDGD
ncbi:MAG: DNA ligase-associated DEXH box helicase [Rickettsiales bacterium]|nr:DNA ligase-associated DEXH box helicase [Rickettsiales bacterium]